MPPSLLLAPTRVVQSSFVDSTRWERYRPRDGDIIIGTYPKCGTTWVQHIVGMLIFRSAAPRDITQVSPWLDMKRFGDQPLAAIEAQTHRRFLKTHLPLDAVPVYQGVKFIHVARDGRDAAMSLHNHVRHYNDAFRAQLDRPASESDTGSGSGNGLIKGPVPGDPAAFFSDWVAAGGSRGNPDESFFQVTNSYWAARDNPDMLLVHFNDLKADLGGEMRRIAAYLGITISEALWPELIAAAGFSVMKEQGDLLLPIAQQVWDRGASRFFNCGTNNRWREIFAPDDLARYEQLVAQRFTPDQARWIAYGRLAESAMDSH
jgi:aryl sulfotransferase